VFSGSLYISVLSVQFSNYLPFQIASADFTRLWDYACFLLQGFYVASIITRYNHLIFVHRVTTEKLRMFSEDVQSDQWVKDARSVREPPLILIFGETCKVFVNEGRLYPHLFHLGVFYCDGHHYKCDRI
jgi:hypothetical protein